MVYLNISNFFIDCWAAKKDAKQPINIAISKIIRFCCHNRLFRMKVPPSIASRFIAVLLKISIVILRAEIVIIPPPKP